MFFKWVFKTFCAVLIVTNTWNVCWLDIMGTKTKMENSVKTCSIFIFKLHTAVLEAIEKGCDIQTYPVMDGVYFTSKRKKDIPAMSMNTEIM